MEDEDLELAARRLRMKLGIDDQLRPDMITVIFKLKDCGMIKNYIRVPDKEMSDGGERDIQLLMRLAILP
jgi:hypothetical protein